MRNILRFLFSPSILLLLITCCCIIGNNNAFVILSNTAHYSTTVDDKNNNNNNVVTTKLSSSNNNNNQQKKNLFSKIKSKLKRTKKQQQQESKMEDAVLSSTTKLPSSTTNTELPSSSSGKVSTLFNDELVEMIADDVTSKIRLPLIPPTIVSYCLQETIGKISTDLSKTTLQQLEEFVASEQTASPYDNMPPEEVDALRDRIASELNAVIDIPLLGEEQEYELLREVLRVIFASLTSVEQRRRKKIMKQLQDSAQGIEDDDRGILLSSICARLPNLPFVSDDQKQNIVESFIDTNVDTLNTLLPPKLIEALKGETEEGIDSVKTALVQKMNKEINILGLNEEQEKQIMESIMDTTIAIYIDDTDFEFALMNTEEQLQQLEERKEILVLEQVLSQRRYEREQANIQKRISRLERQMQQRKDGKSNMFRSLLQTDE